MKKVCLNCGKILEVKYKTAIRKTPRCQNEGRFCSNKCSAIYTGKKRKEEHPKIPNLKCGYCDKWFYLPLCRLKEAKGPLRYCCRKHKDKAQRLDSNIDALRPSHYGNGLSNYRTNAKRTMKWECGCGIKREYLLEVHHKDGNRKNNEIANLEIVCPTCHNLRHLKFINGKWKQNKYSLTPIEKIKEIEIEVFGKSFHS
ncbi:MAG: HNH endonuclease [Candidatus Cloacimonetes bacterium]|jgi:hypothetical protein|nr:HNH endonuclease [Candidatus Cloacimonadota bacterium]